MLVHKFVISGKFFGKTRTFPALNDYIHACNKHPQVGAKMKRDYQMIASSAIRKQLGRLDIFRPVKIHYVFYEADHKRDPSNIAAFAVKVIEDALQDCKVLKNDNWTYMRGYSQEFFVDKNNPRIEVFLKEVD